MEKKKTDRMRIAKNILAVLLLLFLGYHSVYFRNLDEVRTSKRSTLFDPKAYAQSFWEEKLLPNLDQGIDLSMLVPMLEQEPDMAFDTYSHALGIGNIRYFLVKGIAQVNEVLEDEVLMELDATEPITFRIATEFIFGNAVRDASGLISINEFNNTMDFNNVSAAINQIIRSEVIPAFKTQVKRGDSILFYGAIELHRQYFDLSNMEVIPIQLEILSLID